MDANRKRTAPKSVEEFWERLLEHEGEAFYTAKKLPFTYQIRGGELFVDRRSKSITRATIDRALKRVMEDHEHEIRGPKTLNCFGAPYVWALFAAFHIVEPSNGNRRRKKLKSGDEAENQMENESKRKREEYEMVIETAREEDLPELLEIYNYEVLHGTATFDLHPKTLEERTVWFHEHNVGNHPLIVARRNGRAIGYASLSAYRDKEAYAAAVELSVYVSPDTRGEGIGSMLVERILEEARARDDIHTVISVITGENQGSVALHERFGFMFCGRMKEVGEKFGRKLDIINYQLMV